MELRVTDRYAVPMAFSGNNRAMTPGDQAGIWENKDKGIDKYDILQAGLLGLGIIPTIRRFGTAPDAAKEDNWEKVGLLGAMAAANFPGDLREVMRAKGEFLDLFKGKLPSTAGYKGQHAMNVLDGTFLEKWADKFKWLGKLDKPLYDTKIGDFFYKHFNIGYDPENIKEIKIPGFKLGNLFKLEGRTVDAFNFEGNWAKRLVGKSLLRVSVLGLLIGAVMEIPALVKSVTQTEGSAMDKAKAFGKQLIKSAGLVALVAGGIALTGGMFGVTALGSLAGMALGSAGGIMASKGLNKLVDNIFGTDKKKQEINPYAVKVA